MARGLGVLLHITSLPGKQGIGCFSAEARKFVDFMQKAGLKYWQVLPFCPTSADWGNSPYAPLSVFAGNPLFIDLLEFLDPAEIKKYKLDTEDAQVDFELVICNKAKALRDIYKSGFDKAEFENFKKLHWWAEPFAEWMSKKFGDEKDFHLFTQMIFFRQWSALKKYANERGIFIIGDMPFYVPFDFFDVQTNPDVFLTKDGRQQGVGGAPPDSFNPAGQNWGTTLYDFKKQKNNNYKWWCDRVASSCNLFDISRIDHFRAFDYFYKISSEDADPREGEWEKGPGFEIFNAIKTAVPGARLVLEDLGGEGAESVQRLRKKVGSPGMRVLQFAFDYAANYHLPENFEEDCVAYPGTHDNNTFVGFLNEAKPSVRQRVDEYFQSRNLGAEEITGLALERLAQSRARLVVVAIQDFLLQDEKFRMNRPGIGTGQWGYRMPADCLTDKLAARIRKLARDSGRMQD